MRWLDIEEGHHQLSHHPDLNEPSQEKLAKINVWFAQELAYLAGRLAATPEPGGTGTTLDNSLIIWTNDLGKGNSHTLNDIPFVLIGNGCGFKMGRSLKFDKSPTTASGSPSPTPWATPSPRSEIQYCQKGER